jgi:hypothetical protein
LAVECGNWLARLVGELMETWWGAALVAVGIMAAVWLAEKVK